MRFTLRMTNRVLKRYESSLGIIKRLLIFTPMWFDNRIQYCVKWFWPPFLSVLGYFIGYQAFDTAIHASDMNKLTECMVPAIELFAVAFKMMPPILFNRTMRELYNKLDYDVRYYYNNESTAAMEKSTLRRFSLSFNFLDMLHKMLALNYTILPILFMLYQIIGRKSPMTFILPYPGDHPDYIMNNSVLYSILFCLEAVNGYIAPSLALGCHCLFGLNIFQMVAILNALSDKLSKANTEHQLLDALRECVDKQSQFRIYSHTIETIYGIMIFAQRLVDAVVLCGVIFQMHQIAGLDVGKLVMYTSWVIIKFLQQMIYGWFGSQLIAESENFRDAIYSCKWPEFTEVTFMKRIAYVLQQPPLQVNAYGFFVISIPMASSVITTSFSYFFLLQSLDADN